MTTNPTESRWTDGLSTRARNLIATVIAGRPPADLHQLDGDSVARQVAAYRREGWRRVWNCGAGTCRELDALIARHGLMWPDDAEYLGFPNAIQLDDHPMTTNPNEFAGASPQNDVAMAGPVSDRKDAALSQPVPGTPGAAETALPISHPPTSWSLASKSAWPSIPERVRADIVAREAWVSAEFAQYAPFKPLIKAAEARGTTPEAMLSQWRTIEDVLRLDPDSGIRMILRRLANDRGIPQEQYRAWAGALMADCARAAHERSEMHLMTSLDPISDHWISLGGQTDPASQGLSDLSEADHHLHGPSYRDQQHDDVYADTKQALEESRGRAEEREAFDRSKQHRDELTGRYTSAKTGDLISSFVDWDKQFRENPHGAADRLASHYLRQPPGLLQSKAAEAPKSDPLADTPERWRGAIERDLDVQRAVREVWQAKSEDEEFKATAEHRQLLKQAFPHLTFDKALERIAQIDRDLLTNPLEAAARLGASYGMPVTNGQHAAAEQHSQSLSVLDQVIASGQLPGLETDRVLNAVEKILLDPNFPRQDGGFLDLRNAHAVAMQQLGHPPPAISPAVTEAVQWATNNVPRYAELEPLIAEILNRPGMISRSGVAANDLAEAIELAGHLADRGVRTLGPPPEQIAAASTAAEAKLDASLRELGYQVTKPDQKAEHAKRARRASKSVSGSPSPGASSGGRRDDQSSAWDDAAAAYRSAHASV